MSFLTPAFPVLFLVLLLTLKLTKGARAHQFILLVASYIFYAIGDVRFLVLLFAISLSSWFFGAKISESLHTKKAKGYLVTGVLLDIIALAYFKYFNFFAEGFGALLGLTLATRAILLPVGISFYTFQAMSYMIDVYRESIWAEKSPVKVLLYIGFFPQIVSGPIVKARDFLPQLQKDHPLTWKRLSQGVQRFALGLFKKVVIADRLGVCVNAVYRAPAAYSGISILFAVFSYALQIYYDFSGYSDMAIGIAQILGFDLGKNFNLPYLASNPSEFWRRWHISLSTWFRDYVYIPLGGNRKGKLRTYLNLMVTMLLSGLWHGASCLYVIWGALHGLASVAHRMYVELRSKTNKGGERGRIPFAIVNFVVVMLLWVPFRAANLNDVILIYKRLFTMADGIHYIYVYTVLYGMLFLGVEIIAARCNGSQDIWRPLNLHKLHCKIVFCALLLIIAMFAYIGDSAFIYAQF